MKKTVLAIGLLCHAFNVANATQTCDADMIKNAPDSRYSVSETPPIVYDKQTNLSWMRCSIGQAWDSGATNCTGTITTMTWEDSLQSATTANGGNRYEHNDWRLPNIKELASLVENACSRPSINNSVFPNTATSPYWSSSAYAYDSSNAWVVYFSDGNDYYHGRNSSDYRVRLVRSGQ